MGMYAKLMSRVTESSLMEEPIDVRYCFLMMLAIADPQGYVVGTDIAIARRINMPLEQFKSCLQELMKPDENSNSKEAEGRRVVNSDCERGYYLVNYVKYRDTRDEEHRREYMRNYMRKYRDDKPLSGTVKSVNSGKQKLSKLAKAEVKEEADVEVKAKERLLIPENLNTAPFIEKWESWMETRRAMGKAPKDWTKMFQEQLVWLSKFGSATAVEILGSSIRNNYQGLFEPKNNGTHTNRRNEGIIGHNPAEEPKAVRVLRQRAEAEAREKAAAQNAVATEMVGHGGHPPGHPELGGLG